MEAADAPIVGLGTHGDRGHVPTEDFIPYRQEARRLGLGFEVHAGEMGPPSSIVSALDVLEADRIGHGVAAIRDEAVLTRLIRDHVVLDVCPSSNVAIGEFASLEAHPMTEFWRRGVEMTISSDDPPFFGTTLNDELRHLVRIAGLERDDLARSSGGRRRTASRRRTCATRCSPRSTSGPDPADAGLRARCKVPEPGSNGLRRRSVAMLRAALSHGPTGLVERSAARTSDRPRRFNSGGVDGAVSGPQPVRGPGEPDVRAPRPATRRAPRGGA